MTQQTYEGPVPAPQQESDFYWQKCKEHELWLRHCRSCAKAYFYPRDICPTCYGRDTDWVRASGKGSVYTFGIVHQIPRPNYKGPVPFIVALVQLEEGPIFPTNLVNVEADPAVIKVGMPVEVTWDAITDEITLPKFQPAS